MAPVNRGYWWWVWASVFPFGRVWWRSTWQIWAWLIFLGWTDAVSVIQTHLAAVKAKIMTFTEMTRTPPSRTSCPWRPPRRARRPTAAGRSAPTGCCTGRCCRCGAIQSKCQTQTPAETCTAVLSVWCYSCQKLYFLCGFYTDTSND